ncbi:hypothetical protein AAE478_005873 [Parahypoxylon ruwenzoriense]
MENGRVGLKATNFWFRIHNLTVISEAVSRGIIPKNTIRVDEYGMIQLVDANEKEVESHNANTDEPDHPHDIHKSEPVHPDPSPIPSIFQPLASGDHHEDAHSQETPGNDYVLRLKTIIDQFASKNRLPQPLRAGHRKLITDNKTASVEEWWRLLARMVQALLCVVFQLSCAAYDLQHRRTIPQEKITGIFNLLGHLDGAEEPKHAAFSSELKPVSAALQRVSKGERGEDTTDAGARLKQFIELRRSVAVALVQLDIELRKELGKPWEEFQGIVDMAFKEDGRSESRRAEHTQRAIRMLHITAGEGIACLHRL